MAQTTTLTHKFYISVIFLLLAYCILNATYTVIIGGTTFYFFASIILSLQCIFTLRSAVNIRIYASLGLVILFIALLYTHGFDFLTHLKTVVLLPSIILSILSVAFPYKNPAHLKMLKIAFILSLILLAYSQYYDLTVLKNYYDSLHTGESWQQFGAL